MSTRTQETFGELLAKPDEVTQAVREAVRQALVEHHEAGQPVPTWRDGRVVWVDVDENGRYVEPA